jgi:hypothetical protein
VNKMRPVSVSGSASRNKIPSQNFAGGGKIFKEKQNKPIPKLKIGEEVKIIIMR